MYTEWLFKYESETVCQLLKKLYFGVFLFVIKSFEEYIDNLKNYIVIP